METQATTMATCTIICLHLVLTDGHLVYLALFHRYDIEVLKLFYDEYAPDKQSELKESMLDYDTQVKLHHEHLYGAAHNTHGRAPKDTNHSLIGRLDRNPAGKIIVFPFKLLNTLLSRLLVCCTCYHHTVNKTGAVGTTVHRHAYNRKQMGARRVLKTQTAERMGRDPNSGCVYN